MCLCIRRIAKALGGVEGFSEEELLRLAAAEVGSEHPLAAAIVAGAEERGLDLPKAEALGFATGRGVRAVVGGREVLVGNRALVAEAGARAEDLEERGATPVYVVVGGRTAGLVAVADTPRPEAWDAVEQLAALGLEVWMLTGDDRATAGAVASRVGIRPERVLAEVLPGDKAAKVEELRAGGKTVTITRCSVGLGNAKASKPRTSRPL